MKVQCQSCKATYIIEGSKVPETGGSARCRNCGATILIRKPTPVDTEAPAALEDETLDGEERFRMSELTGTAEGYAGVDDDEFPDHFSTGIGIKVKEARNTPKWLIGGVLILALLLAFFQFGGERGWFGLFGGPAVTQSEYQKVTNGMSYSQVAQIIGEPGEETSRSNVEDVPGMAAKIETVSYQWINPDGSNMKAIFQNDRLITKTQAGLH
jgi:predicted Zn finger-like uncharacterized protein